MQTLAVDRERSIETDDLRSGLAIDSDLGLGAGWAGDGGVLERVISDSRIPCGHDGVSGSRTRHEIQIDAVVVHAKGGGGSAVLPLQVVPGPSSAIALEWEGRVVAYDLAGHFVDEAGLSDLVGETFKCLQRWIGTFGLAYVRPGAA